MEYPQSADFFGLAEPGSTKKYEQLQDMLLCAWMPLQSGTQVHHLPYVAQMRSFSQGQAGFARCCRT